VAQVHFKLKEGTPAPERRRVIETLHEHGAKVDPLFPGEEDLELTDIFTASGPEHVQAKDLLDVLNRSKAVDFAEEAPLRKPL
jgi:hypothetical protein